jgi:DNA-binding CsgD family transcriptional regulator
MGAKRRRDIVSVVEAVYAPMESEAEWLEGLLAAVEPEISEGMGVFAYTYDASRLPIQVGVFSGRNTPITREAAVATAQGMDENYVARTWRALSFALASEDTPLTELPAASPLLDLGIHDMVNVNGYEPSGIGVAFHAPLPRQREPQPHERWKWTRVATHVAAAWRLRTRRLAGELPSAILSPNGKLEHAERNAKDDSSRALLREAVQRIEQARGRMRTRDPDGSLELWKCLVDARYTLVDRFEHDGRRYIVAHDNAGVAPHPEVLAPRERQVVAAAAGGRTNKLIAYELGLGDSTVRVLLARAAKKLQVTSRKELVALYLAHSRRA